MAYNIRQYHPLDLKPSTAIGISLPFNGPAVFNSTFLTKDAIKANLLNLFLTNKNERYLNNNFGANLRSFLFEQLTSNNTDFLKEDIQSIINQNINNIVVNSLELNAIPDSNSLNIKLEYSVLNTNINDTIEITF